MHFLYNFKPPLPVSWPPGLLLSDSFSGCSQSSCIWSQHSKPFQVILALSLASQPGPQGFTEGFPVSLPFQPFGSLSSSPCNLLLSLSYLPCLLPSLGPCKCYFLCLRCSPLPWLLANSNLSFRFQLNYHFLTETWPSTPDQVSSSFCGTICLSC